MSTSSRMSWALVIWGLTMATFAGAAVAWLYLVGPLILEPPPAPRVGEESHALSAILPAVGIYFLFVGAALPGAMIFGLPTFMLVLRHVELTWYLATGLGAACGAAFMAVFRHAPEIAAPRSIALGVIAGAAGGIVFYLSTRHHRPDP